MSIDRSRPDERVAEHHRVGVGLTQIGYPIEFRRAELVSITPITDAMVRLTVRGPELATLHSYQCDDHVALVLPDADGTLREPVPDPATQMLDWPRPSPPKRKYTIRRLDRERQEMDLDVVRHDGGLVQSWLADLSIGDSLSLAGPPGAKAFPYHHGHYLFVVDMTAIPSAARWLEEAPADSRTDLLVVTSDPSDQGYPLALGDRDTVTWLERDATDPAALTDLLTRLATPDSFVFAAGEAGELASVRTWARNAGVPSLITGYWRRGVADPHDLDD